MILSPAASYSKRQVVSAGTSPSNATNVGPEPSAVSSLRAEPRPRPLFLHQSLVKLAKDDALGYAFFLEGVTLLAWDIAWLCWTQGVTEEISSWEDICAVGRNLYKLLILGPRDKSETFGRRSHGTSHSLIGEAAGMDHLRGWKFQSHLKIVDKLKAALLNDMTNAEWELLDQEDLEMDRQEGVEDEAVLIRPKRLPGEATGQSRDRTLQSARQGAEVSGAHEGNGWTKLKNRDS